MGQQPCNGEIRTSVSDSALILILDHIGITKIKPENVSSDMRAQRRFRSACAIEPTVGKQLRGGYHLCIRHQLAHLFD